MDPKRWPNILSATRIALMPAVLLMAMAGSRPWFVAMLAISLLTDALDGFLARRFNAFTEFGRKLDSAADYLTMITGIAGIALLWPDIVHRELPWIFTGLVAFFSVVVYGFVRLGRAPCYHTWVAKLGAIGCVASMGPLLAGHSATPFHVVMVLQILGGIEELAIAMLLPSHVGEMPSLWHAGRQRREDLARLEPVRGRRDPAPK